MHSKGPQLFLLLPFDQGSKVRIGESGKIKNNCLVLATQQRTVLGHAAKKTCPLPSPGFSSLLCPECDEC